MSDKKNLLHYLAEAYDRYTSDRQTSSEPPTPGVRAGRAGRLARWLLPNGGTLILIALLIATQSVWARTLQAPAAPGPSATTVNYQGRLADSGGTPINGTRGMAFAIYDAATSGNLIWGPETHAAVPVSNGLFSVGLGSQTSGGIPTTVWNGDRYLEITVGGETLTPRELIRSVPIAGMALTVPDGSVSSAKLNLTSGLSVTGDITFTGVMKGPKSYWSDNRDYIRFLSESGATQSALCPEGGRPVGVVSPLQSLNLKTGNEIAQAEYPSGGTCLNVHHLAACGSIIGNFYPYNPESCSQDFSGTWAPFYWWDGNPSDNHTNNILGAGIGCFPLRYACVQ